MTDYLCNGLIPDAARLDAQLAVDIAFQRAVEAV
jgi:hypothetical protein